MDARLRGNQVFLTERQSDRLGSCSPLEKNFVSEIANYNLREVNKKRNREVWFKEKKKKKENWSWRGIFYSNEWDIYYGLT